jgi:hypothetical protein
LREEAQTNQMLGSNDFANASYWTPFSTGGSAAPVITANTSDVLDPAGGSTACKVVFGASTGSLDGSILYQIPGTLPSSHQVNSIFVRSPAGLTQTFTLVTTSATDQAIFSVTDQWTRVYLPVVNDTSSGLNAFGIYRVNAPSATFYVWGAQAEGPATKPTSYIPTTSAAVTRDADFLTVPNPLHPLSQPVPSWQWGATATPLANWAGGFPASFDNESIISLSTFYGTAGSGTIYYNGGAGNKGTCDIYDSTGTLLKARSSTVPTGANTWSGASVVTTVPTLTITSQLDTAGGGLNDITQSVSIYLGSLPAVNNSFCSMHLTDMFVSTSP